MSKKWIVPIAITLALTFAAAVVAEAIDEEPTLPAVVEIPCESVPNADSGGSPEVCYRQVRRLTRQEEETVMCNAHLSPAQEEEARAQVRCEGVEDIPEEDEDEIIVPLEAE